MRDVLQGAWSCDIVCMAMVKSLTATAVTKLICGSFIGGYTRVGRQAYVLIVVGFC